MHDVELEMQFENILEPWLPCFMVKYGTLEIRYLYG